MIAWCPACETEPVELGESDRERYGYRRDLPECLDCLYRDYPQRHVLGPYEYPEYFAPVPSPYTLYSWPPRRCAWQDKSGVVHVDDETLVDRPNPVEKLLKMLNNVCAVIPWDLILSGPDADDHIIRSEN